MIETCKYCSNLIKCGDRYHVCFEQPGVLKDRQKDDYIITRKYMGYTHFTVSLIEPLLPRVKTVIDLGAQNDYRVALPAPYISDWYAEHNKEYTAIDLSGENGSFKMDLSFPCSIRGESKNHKRSKESAYLNIIFDLLVDAGTSEHVGNNGQFGWEAIYNCWLNKHNWIGVGGLMVNENPKTGNWPGHGFNYYTRDFYKNLEKTGIYKILQLGEHPAMGNNINGWNVFCVMEKVKQEFVSLEEFKELGIQCS